MKSDELPTRVVFHGAYVLRENDLVVPKCGGPLMMVGGEDREDGLVVCSWFVDGIQQSTVYHPAALFVCVEP